MEPSGTACVRLIKLLKNIIVNNHIELLIFMITELGIDELHNYTGIIETYPNNTFAKIFLKYFTGINQIKL